MSATGKPLANSSTIRTGTKTGDYQFPDIKLMCYDKPSLTSPTLNPTGSYNFNRDTRYSIIDLQNGFFRVEGMAYSWFNIAEVERNQPGGYSAKDSRVPDEHGFIVGAWYKNVTSSNFYAKYSKKSYCSEYISMPSGNYNNSGGGADFSKATLCPLEEIQQYLPSTHPDKFGNTQPNMQEILAEAIRRYPIGTVFKSAQSGSEYTVEKNSHRIYGNYHIDVDGCGYPYYDGKWAEIISSSSTASFNKGDKVRVIKRKVGNSTGLYPWATQSGMEGYIVSQSSGNKKHTVYSTNSSSGDYYGIFEDEELCLAISSTSSVDVTKCEYVKWISKVGSGGTGSMCSESEFEYGKVFRVRHDEVPPCAISGNGGYAWDTFFRKDYYLHSVVPSTKEEYEAWHGKKSDPSKKVIFTTHDGVAHKEGDSCYYIEPGATRIKYCSWTIDKSSQGYVYFFSEAAGNEYLREQKEKNKDNYFPPGSFVKIKSDSSYFSQGHKAGEYLKGTVEAGRYEDGNRTNLAHRVNWSDGSSNSYNFADLEPWDYSLEVFPEGTYVRIKDSSEYRDQGYDAGRLMKGEIVCNTQDELGEGNHIYSVMWSDGNQDDYRHEDLQLWDSSDDVVASTPTNKDALLAKAKSDYPIGSTIRAIDSGLEFVLTHDIHWDMNIIWGRDADRRAHKLYKEDEKIWAYITKLPAASSTGLPERWCVKVTEENYPYMNKTRDGGLSADTVGGFLCHSLNNSRKNSWYYHKGGTPFGHTVISFDDFINKVIVPSGLPKPEVLAYPEATGVLPEWWVVDTAQLDPYTQLKPFRDIKDKGAWDSSRWNKMCSNGLGWSSHPGSKYIQITKEQYLTHVLGPITGSTPLVETPTSSKRKKPVLVEIEAKVKYSKPAPATGSIPEKWCVKWSVEVGQCYNSLLHASGYTDRQSLDPYMCSHNGSGQRISRDAYKSFRRSYVPEGYTEISQDDALKYLKSLIAEKGLSLPAESKATTTAKAKPRGNVLLPTQEVKKRKII